MKNLRKKTGCLVMAVLLLIMTFVPAMSVTVSAAANIEGRLITVGGKTVNSGMKIAEVEKLFGKPKLTTPSYWGGYAYTFYGDKYSDYLYLETDADGVIVCYGSVSPGFETNVYNYGDKVDHYVRLGYEATDYDDNLYGVIYYTKYHSDAYERFGANLTENNRNLNKHAAEMWNAVSYLHGYDTPTCFDEQLFNVGAQLADNYTIRIDETGRVQEILSNDYRIGEQNLAMNIYVIERESLIHLIHDASVRGLVYFERDILARNLKLLNVHAYQFDVYVARVSDMKSYFDENMRLLQEGSMDALFGPAPIYTKIRDDNPTRYLEGSSVKNSLLADGCVIEGSVENSVLFRGCKIKKGAVVKNCVLMQDTVVEPNCNVEYVVTDKNVHITEDKKLTGTDTFPVFVAKGHSV